MLLNVEHITRYTYDPAPKSAALRLKLFPAISAGQQPLNWVVRVNGQSVAPLFTEAHGDPVALWHGYGEMSEIEISAGGAVRTADTAGVLRELPQGIPPGVFLRATPLTEADDAIRSLAVEIEAGDRLTAMHGLSALIHKAVAYTKGETDAATTAAEATAKGGGVCQDQAHVFISAARVMGVPARYVAGYVLDPEGGATHDETHAWAEAYVDGLGWTGFDITHQLCPTDAYVRLSCGLDAHDAAPVRGALAGVTEESLTTTVSIQAGQSQTQQ